MVLAAPARAVRWLQRFKHSLFVVFWYDILSFFVLGWVCALVWGCWSSLFAGFPCLSGLTQPQPSLWRIPRVFALGLGVGNRGALAGLGGIAHSQHTKLTFGPLLWAHTLFLLLMWPDFAWGGAGVCLFLPFSCFWRGSTLTLTFY